MTPPTAEELREIAAIERIHCANAEAAERVTGHDPWTHGPSYIENCRDRARAHTLKAQALERWAEELESDK